jgi:hypothetical protein
LTISFPEGEIEEGLREHERVIEELELDRVEADRRQREALLEAVRTEIEAIVRDEYEQRWMQVQERLSPAAKRRLEESHDQIEDEVQEANHGVQAHV